MEGKSPNMKLHCVYKHSIIYSFFFTTDKEYIQFQNNKVHNFLMDRTLLKNLV